MSSANNSSFILLSKLVQKLADNDYYRTYAKTLAYTENSSKPLPADDKLVKEMFNYFISKSQLEIYYNDTLVTEDIIKSLARHRALEKTNSDENLVLEYIWEKEVYIKLADLKKLYANKCIVFPNSLLRELSK
jgi:hypothetical protein